MRLLFGLFCLLAFPPGLRADLTLVPSRGFFQQPIQVQVSSPEAGLLRYTLDGAAPSLARGMEVPPAGIRLERTAVLRVARIEPENGTVLATATHTYLFPQSVQDQPAERPGYINEIMSWRLRSHQSLDWEMDPDIVNDTARIGRFAEHLLSLPSISVALAREDFNHLYRHHAERGIRYERAASVELLYPPQEAYASFRGFQIHCGIRMQGGGAVIKARKKSFRLLFKKEHGPGKLRYPLFESAPHHASSATDVFDNVILRAGGNANWSKDEAWKHEPATYLRDPLVRDSQIAVSGFGARSTFVHLYLNGFYFGLYNLAERPDEKFQASYWGGDPEDYYALNHGGSVGGDASPWEALMHEAQPGTAMRALAEQVDLPSFCDYLINQWYFGSGDWPWNNYYGGLRVSPHPGPLRFFTWDAEFSLWTHTGYLESNDRGWANPLFVQGFSRRRSPLIRLWNAVAEDPEFRRLFADRVHRHCFGDGALTEAKTTARFQRLRQWITSGIVAESARWGDASFGQEDAPRTRHGHWIPACEDIQQRLQGNVRHFITDLQRVGLYPRVPAPDISLSPGIYPEGTQVSLTVPEDARGTVYYTTDESDPWRHGKGTPSNTAVPYRGEPLTLQGPTRIQARLFSDTGEWSALTEGLYLTPTLGFPLRITELMAHPKGDQAYEFIELTNLSATTLPLGSCHFEGIRYRFPPTARLLPHQTLVLIPNDQPDAFAKRYPRVSVAGHYAQHLSNKGETIRLLNAQGEELLAVEYGTPWPRGTRGQGRSLIPKDPRAPRQGSTHWRASPRAGGSPGKR